jgi:hypothetical protein
MKIKKNWLNALIIVALVAIVATGLSFSLHDMTEDGRMTGCPLMGMPVICNMNVQEHIAAWQSMFSAIPTQILLLLVLLLVTSRPIFRYLTYRPPELLHLNYEERSLLVFDHLRESLASGLIHSKAY